jgi:hypothetical protein
MKVRALRKRIQKKYSIGSIATDQIVLVSTQVWDLIL